MRIKVNEWMDLDVKISAVNGVFLMIIDKIDTSDTNKPFLSSRQELYLNKEDMRKFVEYINGETRGKI